MRKKNTYHNCLNTFQNFKRLFWRNLFFFGLKQGILLHNWSSRPWLQAHFIQWVRTYGHDHWSTFHIYLLHLSHVEARLLLFLVFLHLLSVNNHALIPFFLQLCAFADTCYRTHCNHPASKGSVRSRTSFRAYFLLSPFSIYMFSCFQSPLHAWFL